jgi:hypothetical protein
VTGGDIRTAIVARMGLNDQARRDVDALIATGNQPVSTLTWFSAIVIVLGGVGMASTLSAWYHRIYEQTPPQGLLRHFAYQAAGVVAFVLYISVEIWLFDKVRPVGGRGLIFLLTFVFAVLFWSTYLGSGHLRAEELWPRWRRVGADYLPRWLWCLSPCRHGLRSNVERAEPNAARSTAKAAETKPARTVRRLAQPYCESGRALTCPTSSTATSSTSLPRRKTAESAV